MKSCWKIQNTQWLKRIVGMVSFLLMGVLIMGAAPLPSYTNITINVANDLGTRFDYGGNDVYYINFKSPAQGLNALHIAAQSNDLVGVDYTTNGLSGTFYVTDSGGKGYEDEIILLVSVNAASLPGNFSLSIKASGYQVTVNSSDQVTSSNYVNPSVDETFGPTDFIYGPQTWKPTGTSGYPLWIGEDISDSGNMSMLMFVDLYVGTDRQTAGLTDNGNVRVDYQFQNLPGMAAFNAYGYRINTTTDIGWANRTSGTGSSGWRVQPISDLTADVYDAYPTPRHSVDGDDLIWMALHYGTKLGDADWVSRIDIVANGVIDDADVAALLAQFGTTL